MGLLTDILKEIPHTAVLQEKIATVEAKYAATETENAILKDDLREAKAEIVKLKKQVEELSHIDDINEVEIGILKDMAEIGVDYFTSENMANRYPMTPARFDYHLQRLKDAGYASSPFGDDAGWHYCPSQMGLELLVKKNLI